MPPWFAAKFERPFRKVHNRANHFPTSEQNKDLIPIDFPAPVLHYAPQGRIDPLKKRTQMVEQDIIAKINQVFEESFEIEPAKLQPQAHIFNDLGLDSLDVVDLVVAIQKKFGVSIREEAGIRTVQTLGDLYQFVQDVKTRQKPAKT